MNQTSRRNIYILGKIAKMALEDFDFAPWKIRRTKLQLTYSNDMAISPKKLLLKSVKPADSKHIYDSMYTITRSMEIYILRVSFSSGYDTRYCSISLKTGTIMISNRKNNLMETRQRRLSCLNAAIVSISTLIFKTQSEMKCGKGIVAVTTCLFTSAWGSHNNNHRTEMCLYVCEWI